MQMIFCLMWFHKSNGFNVYTPVLNNCSNMVTSTLRSCLRQWMRSNTLFVKATTIKAYGNQVMQYWIVVLMHVHFIWSENIFTSCPELRDLPKNRNIFPFVSTPFWWTYIVFSFKKLRTKMQLNQQFFLSA